MSFDNGYPNRKDWRRAFKKAKAFDRSCRNNGSCEYCRQNRLFNKLKAEKAADAQIADWYKYKC